MAYCAAQEGVLDDPLPIGLGIRIPMPTAAVKQPPKPHTATLYPQQPPSSEPVKPPPALDANGLCDFDDLNKQQMRAAIVELINQLPSVRIPASLHLSITIQCHCLTLFQIETMKRHLERKVGFGKRKPVLRECEPSVSAAAWLVLRW
jgi:ubiquitin-conjugating enzyme E2 Q